MVHPIARILLGQFDFIAAFQMIDRTDMGAAGGNNFAMFLNVILIYISHFYYSNSDEINISI